MIGQFPNWPLWLFGAAWLVAATSSGETARWAHVAALVFLTAWAADELLRGVNPWRRCLGAGMLVWLAVQTWT